MKKLFFFLLYTLSICMFCYAQEEEEKDIVHIIGINARVVDKIPYEVCYKFANRNKKIGFQLKGAYGSYDLKTSSGASSSGSFGYYQQVSSVLAIPPQDIAIKVNAVIIKPGLLFFFSSDKYKLVYFGISPNIAYTNQQLSLTFNDPAYGKMNFVNNGSAFYKGLELEFGGTIFLGKRININGSVVTGYKDTYVQVFDHVIDHISLISNYSPGQGYGSGFYMNILLGIGFTLY